MGRKLKKTREECTLIRKWLKKDDGNTQRVLALMLEYKSSSTIAHWLKNERVTKDKIQQIKEICK